jgi:hypothetical protein
MLLMEFGLTLADILDSTISKASVQLDRTTVVPRTSQATPLSRRPQQGPARWRRPSLFSPSSCSAAGLPYNTRGLLHRSGNLSLSADLLVRRYRIEVY